MKKLLTALLVLCTGAGGVFGLFASSNEPVKLPEDWGNVLVVYYSATGSTEKIAGYIADATGGDVFELVPAEPYTSADLNWRNGDSRVGIAKQRGACFFRARKLGKLRYRVYRLSHLVGHCCMACQWLCSGK